MIRKSAPLWAHVLARKVARFGPNLLLVLPATDRSIALMRAITSHIPCWVIKGQFAESLATADPLADHVRTPAEVVQLTAGHAGLPRPVISMPELVVGDGPSFVQSEYLGELRYFSIVECLLFLRHAPTVQSVTSRLGQRAYGLEEVRIDANSSDDPLLSFLENLLRPIEAEARAKPADWRAKDAMVAKTKNGFAASLREDCRDIEAILRLMLLNGGSGGERVRTMLGAVSAYVDANPAEA